MKQNPASLLAGSERSPIDGDSQLVKLLRARDWAMTPVGPPATWPPSLRTILRVLLSSRCAMWLGWGAELTFFCNEACLPLLGSRQAGALGSPARQVWGELWPQLAPGIERVVKQGQATADLELRLPLECGGQDSYQRLFCSPLPDESGAVSGVLCVAVE